MSEPEIKEQPTEVGEKVVDAVETPKVKEKIKRASIPQKELPRVTLEEAIPVVKAMYDNVAGGSISFDNLAGLLGVSPTNTRVRYLIWGAEAYGIVMKTGKSEYIISETGRKIAAPTYKGEDNEAKVKAILTPTTLSKFYAEYNKHPIPQETYFANLLETKFGIPRDRVQEAKELIINNATYTGIAKNDSKTGKIIIDLEEITSNSSRAIDEEQIAIEKTTEEITEISVIYPEIEKRENVCFVICPIGEDGSTERKHSDMILKHLITPVLEGFHFSVIRADKIERSGLITHQILDSLVKSKLCIADLSFNNPNVFYELGVRHMSQLPSIQIIRKGDKLPFDVSQGRTITIDTNDVYTLIDRLDSAKKELAEYVRAIVNNESTEITDDNPIKVYLPGIKVVIPK